MQAASLLELVAEAICILVIALGMLLSYIDNLCKKRKDTSTSEPAATDMCTHRLLFAFMLHIQSKRQAHHKHVDTERQSSS